MKFIQGSYVCGDMRKQYSVEQQLAYTCCDFILKILEQTTLHQTELAIIYHKHIHTKSTIGTTSNN